MKSPSAPGPRRRVTRRLVAIVVAVAVGLAALGVAAFALVGQPGDDPPAAPAPRDDRAEGERPPEDLSRLRDQGRRGSGGPAEVPAFGMMAWRANQLGPADFALIRASGTRYYRFNLVTSNNDDRERRAPTRVYDQLIRAGATQGIEFLPVLLRTRRDRGAEGPRQVAEPPETARERATWRERVRFFAERYGPEGRFWRENPELPYRPVRAWEVWNEPNLREFWDRREVDPREYARLLRATRSALRSVDPEARIVSAGLSSRPRYDATSYMSAMLDEAGACRVDAIGIHPYAPTAEGAIEHLADARAAADAGGADDVPLWTTEIGWRVGSSSYAGVPNARVQARYYAQFLAATDRRRDELVLGPIFAFALRDQVDRETGEVTNRTGLRRPDGRPRPAWTVWSKAARAASTMELPPARSCGR